MSLLKSDYSATPCNRRMRTLRWLTTAALCASALCVSGVSWAQFQLPKPSTPALVVPASGALQRGAPGGASAVTFKWNQYGVVSMPAEPLPTHFVVCLKRATEPQTCNWPGTWNLPANSGVPIYFNWRVAGYQYTYQAPRPPDPGIDDGLLNSQMTWVVGACVGQSSARCSFSSPRNLWLSTHDLKAVDVERSFQMMRGLLEVTAQADNLGTTPSGKTTTQFVLWQAYNDGPGRCLTNVNAFGLSTDDEVITNNGSQIKIGALPTSATGVRTAPANTIAIRPGGGLVDFANFNSLSIPAGVSSGNLATWSRPLSGFSYPASFVVRVYVDSTNALVELSENDNWFAECLTIN